MDYDKLRGIIKQQIQSQQYRDDDLSGTGALGGQQSHGGESSASDSAPNSLSVEAHQSVSPSQSFSLLVTLKGLEIRIDEHHADPAGLTAIIEQRITERVKLSIKSQLIQQVIEAHDHEYHLIKPFDEEFVHDVGQDAIVSFDCDNAGLRGWITILKPGIRGVDVSVSNCRQLLKQNNVVHGVNHEIIERLVAYPRYNQKIVVAIGTEPIAGKDARIAWGDVLEKQINKDIQDNIHYLHSSSQSILNVSVKKVIGKVISETKGIDGKDVFGKTIEATDGAPLPLSIGKQIQVDTENNLIALTNGHLHIGVNLVDIIPLLTIKHNVDISTGNLFFLGSIEVHGGVEDGFSVKATGPIIVHGSVGKATVDSESNIVIHGGIVGKGGAIINSDQSIYAKFIENATVRARDAITVYENIINSRVVSHTAVRCTGKRANIVGGTVSAGSLISAKSIGTKMGIRTKLVSGLDISKQELLEQLTERQLLLKQQLNTVLNAIRILESRVSLLQRTARDDASTPDKSVLQLQSFEQDKEIINHELEDLALDIKRLKIEMVNQKCRGVVRVRERLFEGVSVDIGSAAIDLEASKYPLEITKKNGKITTQRLEYVGATD